MRRKAKAGRNTNHGTVNRKNAKNITELVFILDRSGSMGGLEADTIGGFNSLINKQKKEEGGAIISTVLFDDRQEVLHDRIPLKDISLMTEDQYYVRGCTALLDAVGETIDRISTAHRYAREEDRPGKTLFVITTDGMENASRRYTYDKVKALVEEHKNRGWEFLFLGANMDAIEVAGRFGIRPERAVNFECDSAGTKLNYDVISKAVCTVRRCEGAAQMSLGADWKQEIEADYKKRHR